MLLKTTVALALVGSVLASPMKRQSSCPSIHVFGARETTAGAGYGSSATVVNGILSANSGATSEAINYPACGGQASCGGASYSQSVQAGFAAVATAVNNFNSQCPSTKLVLVGYSQVWHPYSGLRTRQWLPEMRPCSIFSSPCLRVIYREVKSSILRSAAAVTPTRATPIPRCYSAHQPLLRSRLLSSWATRNTSLAFPTM
jgi:hypothetical protein